MLGRKCCSPKTRLIYFPMVVDKVFLSLGRSLSRLYLWIRRCGGCPSRPCLQLLSLLLLLLLMLLLLLPLLLLMLLCGCF